MTLDDESILSAYLDGQLGPEDQQAVEAALLEDPRLADELRGLSVLRDLLAGLPRESPVDLTSRVMRRVRRRAAFRTARGIVAWGPARAAAIAAIAAAVLMMLAVPWLLNVRRGPAVNVAAFPDAVGKARPGPSEARWPAFATHASHEHPTRADGSEERRPSQAEAGEVAASSRDELVHVREYLDNPQLRRIFLVSDPGDGSDERRVADIVEQTTRFNYYRITISQGIMLDPRHPDEATVFALVVGPREMDSLRDRLRVALKDRVEEEAAEPGVVTQLADIGHAEACPPSPTADMNIPREDLAYRTGVSGILDEPAGPARAEKPEPDERPTREQERSSPIAEVLDQSKRARPAPSPRQAVAGGQQTPGGPAGAQDADPSYVVLVWVSRPRPG